MCANRLRTSPDTAASGIWFTGPERRKESPTGVIIGGADVRPSLFLFEQRDICPVNCLRDDVGLLGGP